MRLRGRGPRVFPACSSGAGDAPLAPPGRNPFVHELRLSALQKIQVGARGRPAGGSRMACELGLGSGQPERPLPQPFPGVWPTPPFRALTPMPVHCPQPYPALWPTPPAQVYGPHRLPGHAPHFRVSGSHPFPRSIAGTPFPGPQPFSGCIAHIPAGTLTPAQSVPYLCRAQGRLCLPSPRAWTWGLHWVSSSGLAQFCVCAGWDCPLGSVTGINFVQSGATWEGWWLPRNSSVGLPRWYWGSRQGERGTCPFVPMASATRMSLRC